jgi:hypothetical protein
LSSRRIRAAEARRCAPLGTGGRQRAAGFGIVAAEAARGHLFEAAALLIKGDALGAGRRHPAEEALGAGHVVVGAPDDRIAVRPPQALARRSEG